MPNHVARLYAAAGAILALFLAWAGLAAHPWQGDQKTTITTPADGQALAAYERRLRKDARLVHQVVRRRAAEARAARQAAAAAAQSGSASSSWSPAPSVRVVTPPPAAAPAASTKTS
jgi:hypothetical protein